MRRPTTTPAQITTGDTHTRFRPKVSIKGRSRTGAQDIVVEGCPARRNDSYRSFSRPRGGPITAPISRPLGRPERRLRGDILRPVRAFGDDPSRRADRPFRVPCGFLQPRRYAGTLTGSQGYRLWPRRLMGGDVR